MSDRWLTPKQDRFVQEYLIDLNASAAAKRAGYSQKNADKIGPQLLGKTSVAKAIAKLQGERSQQTQITAERVLRELARIGLSDTRKLFDKSGALLPVSEWDDDVAAIVSSIETLEVVEGHGDKRTVVGYTKKVKLWDKVSALEKIAKHLGMFVDRLKIEGKVELEVSEVVCRTREEAAAVISALGQTS